VDQMPESENKFHKCFCDWGFGLLLLLFHGALIMTVLIMVEKSPHKDSFYIGSYSFDIKPKMNELPSVEVTETIQFQVIGTFSSFTRVIKFSNNTIETGLPSSIQFGSYSSPNVTHDLLNLDTSTTDEYTRWTFSFPPRSAPIIITYTYEADLLFNGTTGNIWKFNYHLIDDSWSKMNGGTVWGFSKIDVNLELPFAELSNLTMSQDLYGQAESDNRTTLYFKQDYLGLGRDYAIALDFIPGTDENKEHETKKIFGIDWWIFLIAGGVVVVIVGAILINHLVKTRRQKKILILEKQ
jgi:hypothetical protein